MVMNFCVRDSPSRRLCTTVAMSVRPSPNWRWNVRLTVTPVADGVAIEAGRQVLAAVVGNLLQNAFKFTRPRTTVTLRVGASAERVLIEIQDECGVRGTFLVRDAFCPRPATAPRSCRRSGSVLKAALNQLHAAPAFADRFLTQMHQRTDLRSSANA